MRILGELPVRKDGVTDPQGNLELYGMGWRGRGALAGVSVSLCGVGVPVDYAGSQNGFVELDQLNVRLPRSLVGRGLCDLVLTVDGRAANAVQVMMK